MSNLIIAGQKYFQHTQGTCEFMFKYSTQHRGKQEKILRTRSGLRGWMMMKNVVGREAGSKGRRNGSTKEGEGA